MQQKSPPKKLMLAASAGGHLTQLLRIRSAWQQHDNCVYVSSLETARKVLEPYGKTYVIGECNREHPLKVLVVTFMSLQTVLKERPDIVISTGAAPGMLCCLWAKILLKATVVWVDSIANVNDLSMSGKLIRPFADMIITQWPEVGAKYKNVTYGGNIL